MDFGACPFFWVGVLFLSHPSDYAPPSQADDGTFEMPVKVDEFKFPLTAWPLIIFEVVFTPLSFLNTTAAQRFREAIGTRWVYGFWKAVLVIHLCEVSYMYYLCRKHKTSGRIGVGFS